MKRKTSPHQAALTDRTTIKVRFSEIDSMQIVWHGEYVRYFEDGREAFGKRYGLVEYSGRMLYCESGQQDFVHGIQWISERMLR